MDFPASYAADDQRVSSPGHLGYRKGLVNLLDILAAEYLHPQAPATSTKAKAAAKATGQHSTVLQQWPVELGD